METIVISLLQNTLGYSQLETDEQKSLLTQIFTDIGLNIFNEVPEASQRLVYARSILSLEQSKEFLISVQTNMDQIIASLESGEFSNPLELFWDYLYQYSRNKTLKSFTQDEVLILCKKWVSGESLPAILEYACNIPEKKLEMMNIVDLCESGFSYDISTLLGSLYELIATILPEEYLDLIKTDCYLMQKRLKYGTLGELESIIYELGFSDRNLSTEIAVLIRSSFIITSRIETIRAIKDTPAVRRKIENEYPQYFTERLNNLFR